MDEQDEMEFPDYDQDHAGGSEWMRQIATMAAVAGALFGLIPSDYSIVGWVLCLVGAFLYGLGRTAQPMEDQLMQAAEDNSAWRSCLWWLVIIGFVLLASAVFFTGFYGIMQEAEANGWVK